jgi:Fe-S cluster assembly protein SufD
MGVQARAYAAARLAAMGMPVRRDEYWRYTDPASLTQPVAPLARVPSSGSETAHFAGMDCVTLVFVDGVFDAEASDDPVLAGVEITPLSSLAAGHWAAECYGTLEVKGQTPVARPLAALNTARAESGFLIRVYGRAQQPIHMVYRHLSDTSDVILHHFVKIELGAELTLLESGPGGARFNKVIEVDLAADGRFHHVQVQGRDHERRAATHVFARIDARALFKSFTLTANGVLTRNEAVLDIVGDHAVAHVSGAALGDGATGPFHHDDTVFVTHDAVGCESRQVFKKVLKHGATGVFQGKILVRQGAQKTDGYQISQALMLDDDCQFLAKPELEIYADDVKCSHGSTTGAIDEEALFYLRSRGISREDAVALLVLSFLADAISEIEDEGIQEEIIARLESWLARHKD